MRKTLGVFMAALIFSGASLAVWALDPVAPRAERKYGELMVKSPLPKSDTCEVVSSKGSAEAVKRSFKPFETIKLPVGDYQLTVKLQETTWSKDVTIHPTERTDVVVTGYGNLKVTTPNPGSDTVEVYSLDGKMVKSFSPKKVQTLPTGTYNVKVKMSGAEITESNVAIVTNTTREVEASVH